MTENDKALMIEAISLADQCQPVADRIPKVGAVIAVVDASAACGNTAGCDRCGEALKEKAL
jgi:pyrimidine deaminase RibD-like protein